MQNGVGSNIDAVLFEIIALTTFTKRDHWSINLVDRTHYWRQTSPFHRLTQAAQPLMAVCSTLRETSCAQADQLVKKAIALGTRASTLKLDLNHGDINHRLGQDPAYTHAVETFMASLDPAVASRLKTRQSLSNK